MTTPTHRYLPGLVLGAQVYFVPNGTVIDTIPTSSLIAPELPSAAAGLWMRDLTPRAGCTLATSTRSPMLARKFSLRFASMDA